MLVPKENKWVYNWEQKNRKGKKQMNKKKITQHVKQRN